MKKLTIALLLILCANNDYAQEDTSYKEVVANFINCIKYNRRAKLATMVSYPLSRQYPLPEIKTKDEFLKRYDEVFDTKLVKAISTSSIGKDWGPVGWRGIMFLSGQVWLDDDGKLIAVNYQSSAEKDQRLMLIRNDRAALHESLRIYKEPICILETSKFRVRIDEITDGNYRYASWPIKNKMNSKPDLVIENGKVEFDGSGGNHTYHFKNAGYAYDCDIIVMGEDDSPPAMLTISKGNKTLLSQKATLLGD